MVYATQPVFLTHQDCANFRNGLCTLNGATVNPNGPACPNFTPKRTPQTPRVYPTGQQPSLPIQTSPTTLQPNYYLPQQFSHTPYSWEAYSYLFYPAYPPSPTYLWTTYGYGIAPWYAIPFPYPRYGYRTHGYEYQPYCIFPFSTFPRSINEELSTLEVYREELQAEIEALDARIEELRRQLSVAGRR